MSLQFIFGNSGAGKSYTLFRSVIEDSIRHPDQSYLVIVPEQFTMQTQKELVRLHPDGGILNIDILSFERLAYRVFEEVGGDTRRIMEETGKKAETKSKKLAKTKKKSKPSVKERVVAFWKGVKAEFRKIIWPSKESLKNQTIAVLVVSVVLSVFIRFFDIACQYVVEFIR